MQLGVYILATSISNTIYLGRQTLIYYYRENTVESTMRCGNKSSQLTSNLFSGVKTSDQCFKTWAPLISTVDTSYKSILIHY